MSDILLFCRIGESVLADSVSSTDPPRKKQYILPVRPVQYKAEKLRLVLQIYFFFPFFKIYNYRIYKPFSIKYGCLSMHTTFSSPDGQRIASIDHFRGYVIFGMILVNYLGLFHCMPELLKHHDRSMNYADTIAPAFVFISGMSCLMTVQKKMKAGRKWLIPALAKRFTILILIGIVLYNPSPRNWNWWWDALVDIGFAGLLSLLFLRCRQSVRCLAACAFLLTYQIFFSRCGYEPWVMSRSINGGPAGILPWGSLFLLGTLAWDLMNTRSFRKSMMLFLVWGLGLCLTGCIFYFSWGDTKELWYLSQRGMTLPYTLISGGLCFLTFLPFRLLNDYGEKEIRPLRTFGINPLALYMIQYALLELYGTLFVSENAGILPALSGLAAFALVCYAAAEKLRKDNLILRI
jgi:predicted acyltransferase